MANMSLKKNPMPHQPADVRNKNFDEVALGYTPEQAIDEAERCLNCKNKPCMNGCPVMVRIPEFISKIKASVSVDVIIYSKSSISLTNFVVLAS